MAMNETKKEIGAVGEEEEVGGVEGKRRWGQLRRREETACR